MNLQERIHVLIDLGNKMRKSDDVELENVMLKAEIENPWFTQNNIRQALDAISTQFLNKTALDALAEKYHLDDNIQPKNVGIVMAGNIPLVGFHDLMCTFLVGHKSIVKLSGSDTALMNFVIHFISNSLQESANYITVVDRLKNFDAAIATGSNSTAKHFEYYLKDVPHIIRRNRNSVAVIRGNESDEELTVLGQDIFSYFGLGCRNVSKVMVPENYDLTKLFRAFDPYEEYINHNKYKNNVDYNTALFLLNKENFLHNEFMILKQSESLLSRIGCLHYDYYTNDTSLVQWLEAHKDEIQCIISQEHLNGLKTEKFGQAQCPAIDSFADGIDTIQFLLAV